VPIVKAPQIVQLAMFDAQNGWAIDEQHVLRTENGGNTWLNVTMGGVNSLGYSASPFFHDAGEAWVSLSNADYTSGTLYHTTDGGLTWTSTPVPFPAGSLQFLDTSDGFALVDLGAGAGSQGIAIYHSDNGGKSWSQVFAHEPGVDTSLPLSGMKNGLTFLDNLRGWIGGAQPQDLYIWLFKTVDGGHSWQKLDLALPASSPNIMTSVDAPRFFNSMEGILPMDVFTTDTGIYKAFYTTTDSGNTWNVTSWVQNGDAYDFINIKEGWIWDGTRLFKTNDGAVNWIPLVAAFPPGESLAMLDFVNPTNGWAITYDSDSHSRLYRTTDGGMTWKTLIK
jgi:photosystem II stability/assembly factor-like uncharacterized protein